MSIKTLSDIFFANFEKFGENCAVIFNDGENVKKVTYNQLATESCKVTQCLRGLCADGFIGIFVEQDISLPAVILGILHNDLPFACIDVQDSQDRVFYLLKYLYVKWVFTKSNCTYANKALANHGTEVKTLCLHNNTYAIWRMNINFTTENKLLSVSPTFKLAYAIQTSGSTGKPKIIFVPHQCILPNILDIRELLHVHHSDVIFLTSPLTFDPSIVELFLPLMCGAALLIVPSSVKASPSILLEILFPIKNESYSGISILQITPSLFSRWSVFDIQTRILNRTTTLKKLLFGGEPCPDLTILNSWKGIDNITEIYNIYGVTEVSCWAAVEHVNFTPTSKLLEQPNVHGELMLDVPLGSALSKTSLQVRNDEGNQILNGKGELYVGSSERICLVDEETLYDLPHPVFRATGDIVKLHESYGMVFVGRKNRIIKRWGHRVCLSEVETVLNKHPDVEKCCCVWNQTRNILVVAVVWIKNEERQSLRLYSVCHLHKTQVPDKIATVKLLPLTNHGKIDYEKLEYTVLHNDHQIEGNEETSLSSQVVCAWRNVVGREPLVSEKFISCGGNSLLAIQLTSELEKMFGESIRSEVMNMLLNNSCVLEIERYLLEHKRKGKNLDSGETFSRKRKLLCDFPNTLKQEKVEISRETNFVSSPSCSKNLMQNEDGLIKVSCRGTIRYKETLFDSWIKEHDKVCLHFNWKFNMHKCVDASPCYLKFTKKSWVVVGSHSHLLVVLQCPNGEMVSQCELPDRIESSVCPSACGRFGIVGCYNGCVYCVSLEKGNITWYFCTGGMVKCTPVLCLRDTAVVVGSYDCSLYCIHVQDGKLIWSISPSSASIYASPCISSNNTIYIGTLNGTCVSLCEKTGQLLWKTQVSSPVFSSPVLLHSSKGIIFTEVVGIVNCFSAITGDKMWEFKANGQIFSSFSTIYYSYEHYELLVFGSHDKNIYCLKWNDEVNEISLYWKQELDSSVFATPFIYQVKDNYNTPLNDSTDSMMFTYVMAAASKGIVYILNVEDGSIECIETLPCEIFSSPTVCEGQLLVGCRDNYLYSYILLSKKLL